MPFRPHLAVGALPSKVSCSWLQLCLGRIRLSPSCPIRHLHYLSTRRPVRHYPLSLDIDPWPRAERDFNPPETRAARHALSASLTSDVCLLGCPPFRLRVPHHLDLTFRSDDTRPPWVTRVSSPPCRPHTPWCDGVEPMRLRPNSAGSTIPHLWPTGSSSGWLPSITTRWFSSCPSDPTSRWAPCPPKFP